jgi:hypothetical protein
MYYANKKFLVQVERAETDGYLDFGETAQPYFEGNMIATDEYGNQSVLTENYFYENFVGVRKLRKGKTPRKSIEDYAKGYIEMGQLVKQSNENDENYIFDPKKAF